MVFKPVVKLKKNCEVIQNMASLISGIIMLAIGVVVLANVFIYTVKNTCTSTWDAGEVALWGTLSLVSIAAMVVGVLQVFGLA